MNDLHERGEFKLEKEELKKIKENFCSESLSDKETKSAISEVYKSQGILVDPHTAVAIGAAKKLNLKGSIIILATAHPSKFPDAVIKSTNIKPELPSNYQNLLIKKEKYEKLPKDFKKIKNYILKRV